MQFIKTILWILVGSGVTLTITNDNPMVRQVGASVLVIALLWQLLLYLRNTQTPWERINALGTPKLSILDSLAIEQPAGSLNVIPTPVSAAGRTPVQKLLEEEPPR